MSMFYMKVRKTNEKTNKSEQLQKKELNSNNVKSSTINTPITVIGNSTINNGNYDMQTESLW